MKVLFISNDVTLFDNTTPAYARMKTYADAIGELHILSRAAQRTEMQDGNLYLYGLRPLPTIIGRALFFYTLMRHARALVRGHYIDVVSSQDPFEHGCIAMRAIKGTSSKLHIQVHTDFLSPYFAKESYKNRMRVRIADYVLPKATGIRVVSKRIKKSLINRYDKRIQEPTIIPITISTTIPAPVLLPEHTFKFTLISVGRLEPEKRVEDILLTLKLLTKQYSMVGLFIAGDGSDRNRLKSLVHTLELDDRVIFLGSRLDAQALISSANVFIQASAYEGYGRTYFEAALAGTPMVVTDAGVIGDVFTHNKSALVCRVGDVKCLAHEISRLIEDVGLRYQLSSSARKVAESYLATFADLPSRIADNLKQTLKLTND